MSDFRFRARFDWLTTSGHDGLFSTLLVCDDGGQMSWNARVLYEDIGKLKRSPTERFE